jgi:zinc D-Ala-D-Ala dipeptidase
MTNLSKYLIIFIFFVFSVCEGQFSSYFEVPIQECREELIDLKDQNIIAYVSRGIDENDTCYTKMRKTVYNKLCQAQALMPSGYRFLVYCGWRSIEQQQMAFNLKMQKLKAQFPDKSEEEIFAEASQIISPILQPDGKLNVPPHSTGGAIDLCLIDKMGDLLDMGAVLENHFEIDPSILQTDSNLIGETARNNRNIMCAALEAVGFVNYEKEYWHWSYGDRRWAYKTQSDHAIYGSL